jgi:hypothetical protein
MTDNYKTKLIKLTKEMGRLSKEGYTINKYDAELINRLFGYIMALEETTSQVSKSEELVDSPVKEFIKKMGWDEPEYGWTEEKKALEDLLATQKAEFLEMLKDETTSSDQFSSNPDISFGRKYRDALRAELRERLK